VAAACTAAHILLFLVSSVWLRRIRGEADESSVPWLVPAGSATMVAAWLLFAASIWPVFGLLSPLIVFLLAFGLLMGLMLLPNPFGLLGGGGAKAKQT
jgi:hypothetical protein